MPEDHEYYTPQKIEEIINQVKNTNYLQISNYIPVQYANKLKIVEQKRQKLKTLLNNLADSTQNFHLKCPVQDIVDPELMPNYGYRYQHLDQKLPVNENEQLQAQQNQIKIQEVSNQKKNQHDQLDLKQSNNNHQEILLEYQQQDQLQQLKPQILQNQQSQKQVQQEQEESEIYEEEFEQFKESFQGTNEYYDTDLYYEEEDYQEVQKNYKIRFKKWKNRVQKIVEKEQPYKSLREQYQWIPTIFKIGENNTVKIQGKIHNLEIRDNKELYELIAGVFQAQLPLLENILKIQPGLQLQVVFKAQKYILQPGQSYSGKWHLEGKTENIKAASVYYISIDEGFEYDYVNFRTLELFDTKELYPIPIKEQCSLVFPNILPHRFDKLENKTDKPIERLFMNFFIVDPEKPICMNAQDIEDIKDIIAQKMNLNIAKYIMTFLGFEFDLDKAKQRRQDVRDNSDKETSGWGFVHYGNDGEIGFVDTFHTDKSELIKYQSYFDVQ